MLSATLLFMASIYLIVNEPDIIHLLLAVCHAPVHGLYLDQSVRLNPRRNVPLGALVLGLVFPAMNKISK